MKVTPAHIRTIDDWFLRTIGRKAPVCSVCAGSTWFSFPWLVHAPVFAKPRTPPASRLARLGTGMPLILMECRQCGHVLTFDATRILNDEVKAFVEAAFANGGMAQDGT